MKIKVLFLTTLLFFSSTGHAIEYISGKITRLEPTHMPTRFKLLMDTGNSSCPAGTWLTWEKSDKENVKAIYSTALAALMGGKKVNFVINDGDTSCKGQYFHIYP